jgi:hypothetical protein
LQVCSPAARRADPTSCSRASSLHLRSELPAGADEVRAASVALVVEGRPAPPSSQDRARPISSHRVPPRAPRCNRRRWPPPDVGAIVRSYLFRATPTTGAREPYRRDGRPPPESRTSRTRPDGTPRHYEKPGNAASDPISRVGNGESARQRRRQDSLPIAPDRRHGVTRSADRCSASRRDGRTFWCR